MNPLVNASKAAFRRLWRGNAPLTVTASIMVVGLGVCLIGLWVDPRQILGAPAWLKPAKFAASIAVYCVTLAWLFNTIPSFTRTRRVVGWMSPHASSHRSSRSCCART